MLTIGEIFSRLFDVGLDILASTIDQATGTLTAQFGDVTKDQADSDSAELWFGSPGIAGRPALPTQGKASCQVICLKRSDHDIGFAYRDLRGTKIYGNLAPGETAIYATTGQALEIFKVNGSAHQQTTDDNTETGNVIFAGVSSYYQGADGQPHLGGEWRYYAPWGGAWHDPSGYHLRTWHGIEVDIGGLVLPSPIGAKASTYKIKSDVFQVKAAACTFGDAGSAQALVRSTDLQEQMVSFAGDLSSFTTALDTFCAAIGAYATAIAGVADPSHAATPTLITAISTIETASSAFSSSTGTLMGALAVSTGARSTAAS